MPDQGCKYYSDLLETLPIFYQTPMKRKYSVNSISAVCFQVQGSEDVEVLPNGIAVFSSVGTAVCSLRGD